MSQTVQINSAVPYVGRDGWTVVFTFTAGDGTTKFGDVLVGGQSLKGAWLSNHVGIGADHAADISASYPYWGDSRTTPNPTLPFSITDPTNGQPLSLLLPLPKNLSTLFFGV